MTAEWWTRVTIWIAVACYALGTRGLLLRRTTEEPKWLRWEWSAGAGLLWLHALLAFGAFYQWSFAIAYAETARQTAELTGWQSGAGLYANFLFGLAWTADAVYLWLKGWQRYGQRRPWITAVVHGYLGFIVFNGTVVFASGPVRWFGVAVFSWLAVCLLWSRTADTKANFQ